MEITLTWQTIITIAAIIAAIATIIGTVYRMFKKIDQIMNFKKEIEAINAEQQLLVFGILACLRGLKEKGCNGTVTEMINKIEKHVNIRAHTESEM